MKMQRVLITLVVVGLMSMPAFAFSMNFEEGLGNDGGGIVGVAGVTFTSSGGETWKYADINTGGYNVHSVDTGAEWGTGQYNMYGDVIVWLGISGNWGRIDFDDTNGTWFQTGACAYNATGGTALTLDAYDAGGNLLDSDSTVSNLRYIDGYADMAWLRVDAPGGSTIAYVILSDSGNFWEVDNMSGDMAGGKDIIPEPGTLSLLALGLAGMAVRRFRK